MKNGHERITEIILLFLDHALIDPELEDFRSHLTYCSACRERLEEQRILSTMLHEVRPLYVAPLGLRERVAAAAKQGSPACSCESDCDCV